ncbi:Protein-L-isoaspartate O-methyltransferase [Pseudovibrio axinellae]|uniref:Protein-L-isoaspartate O-methyltransferase n=1 Tax=Pseudovibrio axinellae TaxID=989403 RepID=A0A165ZAE4_9HYPH|nr:protein-L-isoaspartate O-methyltransferase [Pseudovibrio axinellae]KZL19650.1 Protein-L-isoaspartate O-methyltransferase [Pseudovibrio axinellae]SEQ35521.1 protein-L-isoaspartate(D-aspartate) O-methyltransferase [Pseudovibrio axinellae]
MSERAYAQEVCYNLRGGNRALLLDAFANIRKENFLFPPPWHVAITTPGYGRRAVLDDPKDLYQDMLVELIQGANINTGQPSLWAQIFNWSALKKGMTVFESGSGLGYFTAIIAHVIGPEGVVYFDEPHEQLHDKCQENLKGFENIHADYNGALLDRAYLCYGTTTVPASLYLNTKVKGQIVFPFTDDWGHGCIVSLKKKKKSCELKVGPSCGFVISRNYRHTPYASSLGRLFDMSVDIKIVEQALDENVLDIARMIHLALAAKPHP